MTEPVWVHETETEVLIQFGPSKSVEDLETTSGVEVIFTASGKELKVFSSPESPELEISNEFTKDNILANFTGINATLSQIKIEQKPYDTMIGNLKVNVFKDLNGLTKI